METIEITELEAVTGGTAYELPPTITDPAGPSHPGGPTIFNPQGPRPWGPKGPDPVRTGPLL